MDGRCGFYFYFGEQPCARLRRHDFISHKLWGDRAEGEEMTKLVGLIACRFNGFYCGLIKNG